MSKAANQLRQMEDPFFEQQYTAEITKRMTVPKHILASGDTSDEFNLGNHWITPIALQEKFDMQVPDRILVAGQDRHIGTKAPPRELELENAVMPPDPGFVRVHTPPRVITLDQHFIPSADEMHEENERKNSPHFVATRKGPLNLNGIDDLNSSREITPETLADVSFSTQVAKLNLTPAEEVVLLRRQVSKLSRRVFAVEHDIAQQQQRDRVVLALGIAYFLVKTVLWLTKSSN